MATAEEIREAVELGTRHRFVEPDGIIVAYARLNDGGVLAYVGVPNSHEPVEGLEGAKTMMAGYRQVVILNLDSLAELEQPVLAEAVRIDCKGPCSAVRAHKTLHDCLFNSVRAKTLPKRHRSY